MIIFCSHWIGIPQIWIKWTLMESTDSSSYNSKVGIKRFIHELVQGERVTIDHCKIHTKLCVSMNQLKVFKNVSNSVCMMYVYISMDQILVQCFTFLQYCKISQNSMFKTFIQIHLYSNSPKGYLFLYI